jgi:ResB-like family
MTSNFVQFFKPLASLKLTIVCLACAMVLVFVGTLDQVHIGIFEAQNRYFKSFFLYFSPPGSGARIPWFPGGYLVGSVLLINLIAAHAARFKFSWRKSGIWILHSGLILLLLGQLFTSLFQEESQMRLNQGETKNFAESPYFDEVAIIDRSANDSDQVTAIPTTLLHAGKTIDLPTDGLRLAINSFYPNAALISPNQLPSANYPHLQIGPMAIAVPVEKTYKQDERNLPAVSLSLSRNGETVGTWNLAAGFPRPLDFQMQGKNYQIVLRPRRYYDSFSIRLQEFRHDRYAGTDIAKNFSSKVQLIDPAKHENREALIFMNHPLRYSGLTFYQAGFDNNDQTTILQVVKNPSWLVPYISCTLLVLGLLVQFGMHLVSFVRRRVIAFA